MALSKPFLDKSNFAKESGLPERYIDACCHSEWADKFLVNNLDPAHESRTMKRSKLIDTEIFLKLQRAGNFKEYA